MTDGMQQGLAVVTGASSGIGAALARQLAARGHRVLAVARRAERLAELEAASGGAVVPMPQDLTADGAAERVAARAAELGGAEMLVSNAGFGNYGPFWKTPHDRVMQMLRLNVLAGADLAHRLLPGMIEKKRGGVLVVTSSGGVYPTPNLSAYGGTKAFLLLWAEALAMELKGTGVRVMAACPGVVSSEFGEVAGMAELMKNAPGVLPPDEVAKSLLSSWDAGNVIAFPGGANWLMTALLQRLPRALTRKLTAAMFMR